MCGLASQNVDENGGRSRLGLGKNLGPLQHYLNPFISGGRENASIFWVFLVILGL